MSIKLICQIRAVAMVTEAAATVCGQEARDGIIRTTLHSREKVNKYKTKSDIMVTFTVPSST